MIYLRVEERVTEKTERSSLLVDDLSEGVEERVTERVERQNQNCEPVSNVLIELIAR